MDEKRNIYISAKLSHLKHNISGEMIMLPNPCINIGPEKFNLGQIQIVS